LSELKGWRHAPVKRHDVIAIPIVWVALLLSLHFHAAMLWFWLPRIPQPTLVDTDVGKKRAALVAQLAPVTLPAAVAPSPPPAPPPPVVAAPPPRVNPPAKAAARPAPPALTPVPPPVAPLARPAPSAATPSARPVEPLPAPVPPPAAAPAPPPVAPDTDLASYVEARRRERGAPSTTAAQGAAPNAPHTETETERLDRIVAANLAPTGQPTFGYDPKSGGGVFQLRRVGYEDAEFWFTGWDKDIKRRAKQVIEVRRGTDSDIRQSIVRKMIAIIRDEVKGDFTWTSERLGRQIVMSARPADNAALESFLMEEFFSADSRRPR